MGTNKKRKALEKPEPEVEYKENGISTNFEHGWNLLRKRRRAELEASLLERLCRPGEVPAFQRNASGTPHDLNFVAPIAYWGRHADKQRFVRGDARVDIFKFLKFLSRECGRLDEHERPIVERFGPPKRQQDGWYRFAWHKYEPNDLHASGDWQTGWHGCKLEAVYSIAYHGGLAASSNDGRGNRFLKGCPGVYVHGPNTADKAHNYMRYVPLFADGVFWASKWEVAVDRNDKVPTKHYDQWVQHERSVRLRALWIQGKRGQDLTDGSEFQAYWDPMLEVNPRDALIFNEPPPPLEAWSGMRFYCSLTCICTPTAAKMREHMKGNLYKQKLDSSPEWQGTIEYLRLARALEDEEDGYGLGAGGAGDDSDTQSADEGSATPLAGEGSAAQLALVDEGSSLEGGSAAQSTDEESSLQWADERDCSRWALALPLSGPPGSKSLSDTGYVARMPWQPRVPHHHADHHHCI